MRGRTKQEHFAEHNTIMRAALEVQLASGQTVLYGPP